MVLRKLDGDEKCDPTARYGRCRTSGYKLKAKKSST